MPTVKSKNPRIQKSKTLNKSNSATIANDIILTEQLQKHFGFNSFKEPQKEIINSLLSGKDTFVIMPTGGGKSLCYQLPAIISEGCAIIVSPIDCPHEKPG